MQNLDTQMIYAEKRAHRKVRRYGVWGAMAGFYVVSVVLVIAGAFVPGVADRIATMGAFLALLGGAAHAVFAWYMKISSDEFGKVAGADRDRRPPSHPT